MLYVFIGIMILSFVFSLPKVKGYIGEGLVRGLYLNRLGENYVVLNDLLLPAGNGKTSQIDHVVVSPFGVFVIETKNYKGFISGSESSQYWTQSLNKRKFQLYNPIWQNNGHIKALKELLADLGDVPFISIVALGIDAKLKVTASTDVVNFNEVKRTIKKYQQRVIDPKTVEAICERLRKSHIPGKTARKAHVAAIYAGKAEHNRKVEQGICPRCGGQLVQRNGKYGSFMGCSGYPKCRYVLKNA